MLTRRYSTAPSGKTPGGPGLEVLKGRQIERPNKAEVGSDGPIVARASYAL